MKSEKIWLFTVIATNKLSEAEEALSNILSNVKSSDLKGYLYRISLEAKFDSIQNSALITYLKEFGYDSAIYKSAGKKICSSLIPIEERLEILKHIKEEDTFVSILKDKTCEVPVLYEAFKRYSNIDGFNYNIAISAITKIFVANDETNDLSFDLKKPLIEHFLYKKDFIRVLKHPNIKSKEYFLVLNNFKLKYPIRGLIYEWFKN